MRRELLHDYYRLTKPGIIRGNIVHTLAGALFAAHYGLSTGPLVAVVLGTCFIIASACVVNNYTDRGLDSRMKRTKSRASVTGSIPLAHAAVFAVAMLVIGVGILIAGTNWIVVVAGLVAYIFYTVIYAVAKRRSVHGTLVGAVPGALPILAGYAAMSGRIDVTAWLLFGLVFVWQLPHFYAISIFRRDEYREANVPVAGAVQPFTRTRRWIVIGIFGYLALATVLLGLGAVHMVAGSILVIAGAYWAWTSLRPVSDEVRWARKVFGVSLLLALLLLAAAVAHAVLVAVQ